MCLILILLLLSPRLGAVMWWLVDSARWTLTFGGNFLLPALGILFLPWTTIVYVLVAPLGLDGLDWVWLVLAAVADLSGYLGGGWKGRNRMPGYGSPMSPP